VVRRSRELRDHRGDGGSLARRHHPSPVRSLCAIRAICGWPSWCSVVQRAILNVRSCAILRYQGHACSAWDAILDARSWKRVRHPRLAELVLGGPKGVMRRVWTNARLASQPWHPSPRTAPLTCSAPATAQAKPEPSFVPSSNRGRARGTPRESAQPTTQAAEPPSSSGSAADARYTHHAFAGGSTITIGLRNATAF